VRLILIFSFELDNPSNHLTLNVERLEIFGRKQNKRSNFKEMKIVTLIEENGASRDLLRPKTSQKLILNKCQKSDIEAELIIFLGQTLFQAELLMSSLPLNIIFSWYI